MYYTETLQLLRKKAKAYVKNSQSHSHSHDENFSVQIVVAFYRFLGQCQRIGPRHKRRKSCVGKIARKKDALK